MCTVTWLERDDGYDLLSNRDERRTRGRALPPRVHRTPGGRYLAPIDRDAGGTWIAVNDRGLGLTLLNDYASDAGEGEFESRGLLVARLAREATPSAAVARLRGLGLERYRPFRLLLLAPGERARVRHWNGRREAAEAVEGPPLLTSSGFDPAAVDAARRALLGAELGEPPELASLLGFHRSHRPERGPLSPCMHREDASTVSFTRVRVGGGRVSLSYLGGPPCRAAAAAEDTLELPLASPAAAARE